MQSPHLPLSPVVGSPIDRQEPQRAASVDDARPRREVELFTTPLPTHEDTQQAPTAFIAAVASAAPLTLAFAPPALPPSRKRPAADVVDDRAVKRQKCQHTGVGVAPPPMVQKRKGGPDDTRAHKRPRYWAWESFEACPAVQWQRRHPESYDSQYLHKRFDRVIGRSKRSTSPPPPEYQWRQPIFHASSTRLFSEHIIRYNIYVDQQSALFAETNEDLTEYDEVLHMDLETQQQEDVMEDLELEEDDQAADYGATIELSPSPPMHADQSQSSYHPVQYAEDDDDETYDLPEVQLPVQPQPQPQPLSRFSMIGAEVEAEDLYDEQEEYDFDDEEYASEEEQDDPDLPSSSDLANVPSNQLWVVDVVGELSPPAATSAEPEEPLQEGPRVEDGSLDEEDESEDEDSDHRRAPRDVKESNDGRNGPEADGIAAEMQRTTL